MTLKVGDEVIDAVGCYSVNDGMVGEVTYVSPYDNYCLVEFPSRKESWSYYEHELKPHKNPRGEIEQDKAMETYDYLVDESGETTVYGENHPKSRENSEWVADQVFPVMYDESGSSSCGVSCGTWGVEQTIQDVDTMEKSLVLKEDIFNKSTPDMVNSPSHYGNGQIECIDYIKDTLTNEELIGYLRGNLIKYQHRFRYKNGTEDLKKAEWYLKELIKAYEEL